MPDHPPIIAVRMPKWGLSMQEGTLLRWNVRPGEHVEAGAPLCEIETAKITNEFEAPASGIVARLLALPEEVIPIGKLIAVLVDETAGEAEINALVASEAAAESIPAPTTEEGALHFAETASGRVAYLEGGDRAGATLLFVHGFGGDHANWTLNQGVLSANHRTIAVDLPGHGASDARVAAGSPAEIAGILQQAIDALRLERLHIIAHSFGAAVALSLIAARPTAVRSATLIAPLGLGLSANAAYVQGFVTQSESAT